MLGRYREAARVWSDPVGRALFRLRLRPNHLTILGLVVSLFAAGAFIAGQVRTAGFLLIAAGLFDLLDGSLARASGQVTAFGAFLDSVIDRYSDLVVLLGIVVLFAQMSQKRGALIAMAGLVGSVMVSYTKARAESIGVECNVGFMERPERMLCLIAGALFDVLEPALWVLAILANITALQRILFTRRRMSEPLESTLVRAVALVALLLPAAAHADASPPSPETERAWAQAVAAYQAGDPAPVAREFATDAALLGPIGDHVGLLLADARARRGDFVGARAAALGVAEHFPDSLLVPRALVEAALYASRADDDGAAQAALKRLLERYPDAPDAPEALYLLAGVAQGRGQSDVAAALYRHLIVVAPATGWADGASDRLAVLAAEGTVTPALTDDQRIGRAERLLRGGVPKIAADEAERIVAEARDPGVVQRALRVVADAAQRMSQWDAAARALEMAAARAPREQRARLDLERAVVIARSGWRERGDAADALARTAEQKSAARARDARARLARANERLERALELFASVARSGGDVEASEALYHRAHNLEDLDRGREAADVYRALTARYPTREVSARAWWRLGWLAWLRGDVAGAERQWARLATADGGRAYRTAALYWRGRALEQTQHLAAARELYAQVLAREPRGYYGLLAAQHLPERDASAPPAASVQLPADPAEALAADPGFARVELLRRIGLVESAWSELEEVVNRSIGDTVRLYGASSAYVREERYHLALRIFRRHFASLAASDDPGLPRAFWEMLYPFGWRDDVAGAARRNGIDPFLVAAVVREESSYYPRAQSPAGARGLMQLMPNTARPMAEVRGLAFERGDLLDDPRANLEIGAAFLAGLLKEFPDPRLAIAAYNAGAKRARDWWGARRTNDIEVFVEQIPYDETRNYVKRVMLSWHEYRRIYGP